MKISIELSDLQAEKLHTEARRLGVEPQDLAAAAVVELLNREAYDFDQTAEHVLRKSQELCKRPETAKAARLPPRKSDLDQAEQAFSEVRRQYRETQKKLAE
jgi:predicted lipoprotein